MKETPNSLFIPFSYLLYNDMKKNISTTNLRQTAAFVKYFCNIFLLFIHLKDKLATVGRWYEASL